MSAAHAYPISSRTPSTKKFFLYISHI